MSLRIYVEGGGNQRPSLAACRRASRSFFEKILGQGAYPPRIIAAGDRRSAYDDFCRAIRSNRDGDTILLLADSEGPVTAAAVWTHLRQREGDQWARPDGATEDQAHLMVQCMESWLLADRMALREYYGQGFLSNSLPGNQNVEEIARNDVLRHLQHATRPTQKGEYHKTRHGFDILENLNPTLVRGASQHAERLCRVVNAHAIPRPQA